MCKNLESGKELEQSAKLGTSFRYPCYKSFLNSLGRFDAICGYSTLAIRLMNQTLSEQKSPRDWLSKTASENGLVIHQIEVDLLPTRLAEMYILLVHAEFEAFLDDFLNEHWPSKAWSPKGQEWKFHWILSKLDLRYQKETKLDRLILEYYWKIRNQIAHSLDKTKGLEKTRSEILEILDTEEKYLAPRTFDKLDYSDFNLYTRTVKRVALWLCANARPSDREIASAILGDVRKLFKLKTKPERFRNALAQYLHMRFQLDKAEADPIVSILLDER